MATTTSQARRGPGQAVREQVLPVVVVLALVLLAWYGLAVALNAQGAIERTLADQPWTWRDLVLATLDMQRPVLPSPHQVALDLWSSLTGWPLDSPRTLLFHAAVTAESTLVGFVLSTLLGLLLSICILHSRTLDKALLPWIVASQSVPALEGALKLKEITYAHCEGMLSTEFKHGPLSAVSKEFPIVFVAGPNDVPLIISGVNEVKVRGARMITIAEEDSRLRANGDDLVVIPKSDAQISALLGVLPLQLLSYHMSVLRGFDPDFPRNLSKTLKVD